MLFEIANSNNNIFHWQLKGLFQTGFETFQHFYKFNLQIIVIHAQIIFFLLKYLIQMYIISKKLIYVSGILIC